MATGLWNIGPINLPDFGVSEALSSLTGGDNVGGLAGGLIQNNANLNKDSMQFNTSYTNPQTGQPADHLTDYYNNTPSPAGSSYGGWTSPTQTQQQSPAPINTNSFDYRNTARQDLGGMTVAQWEQDQAYRRAQEDRMRGEISSGWDNYLGSLNDIYNNGLSSQRSAQEDIANTQYGQGVNTLNTQKAQSLRDIAGNIKNAFQAGNIYLGARGAGDSSAANQYSFAVQQQGNKQIGDLNNFVTSKIQELRSQKDQQINQIASWFADAQNQIKQQIATGQLNKSRDIQALTQSYLDRALQAKQQIEQNAQAQYNGLLSWAASNSQNLGQLKQNIAGIPQAIGAPQIDSSGNFRVQTGYGYGGNSGNEDQNKRALF